jgi:hypothetical protein
LPESDLIEHAEEICVRTGRALFLANYALACLRSGYAQAYSELVNALHRL